MPLISVIIPTRHRAKLVLRAIDSVVNQTFRDLELIVVVDGPDDETVAAVRSVSDPRLRMVINPRSLTAAGARNVGADLAIGDWIAFLDDDDEWLPDKLERQMNLASHLSSVLVTCLSQVVTPNATYIWPRVAYDNTKPIDEYLFDRRSFFMGDSFIQTSSYLLPRRLFNKVRFDTRSPHDDWEFLLSLTKKGGARIETAREVLVTHHLEEPRASLSSSAKWRHSVCWIDNVRHMVTPRAYSGFCLGVIGARAAREGAYAAIPELLCMAFRRGSPTLRHVIIFLCFWMTPYSLRRRLRASISGSRKRESRLHSATN
jgi:glycosyltransferase involved in cell wall biosynthesis